MTMSRTEATPPTIQSAEDLLKKIRNGVKETTELYIRSTPFTVRIITIDEMLTIRRDGRRYANQHFDGDKSAEHVFIQKYTLLTASKLTAKGVPGIPENLLGGISLDELDLLYKEYLKFMDDVNPSLEQLPPEQFQALVTAIKKKTIGWSDCTLQQLRAIFTAYQDLILRLENQDSHKDS